MCVSSNSAGTARPLQPTMSNSIRPPAKRIILKIKKDHTLNWLKGKIIFLFINGNAHSDLRSQRKHCDASASTAASSSISSVKNVLPIPEKKTSRNRKAKSFGPHYLGSKSGRKPKQTNAFSQRRQNEPTSGQSNLTGTA